MSTVSASVFKAKCLELMDQVERTKEEVTVTKYGRPIAKLVPLSGTPSRPFFGRAKGTIEPVSLDVFSPEPEIWSVLSED